MSNRRCSVKVSNLLYEQKAVGEKHKYGYNEEQKSYIMRHSTNFKKKCVLMWLIDEELGTVPAEKLALVKGLNLELWTASS